MWTRSLGAVGLDGLGYSDTKWIRNRALGSADPSLHATPVIRLLFDMTSGFGKAYLNLLVDESSWRRSTTSVPNAIVVGRIHRGRRGWLHPLFGALKLRPTAAPIAEDLGSV